ncbi:FAD-dependent oxidoreductase [Pseudomonas sp.]|uniref:NAD(P)/FAD-dependent oxidoreductase n=1 Tax=Pseudomonas sp. TaxID=306 RepID=UPI0025E45807|nr:FAD-dependent oxidoreductase [Pseudomonas sp.]
MRAAIVGAGIAGLACASRLARAGLDVTLFDKGNRPGGRLTSVSFDGMTWDIGAQYFTARHPDFKRQAEKWVDAGVAAPWPEGPAAAIVGLPTMSSLIAAQCEQMNACFGKLVRWLDRDDEGWFCCGSGFREGPFDVAIVAVPAEQAAPLLSLHDLMIAREATLVRSVPCWTVMLAFDQPLSHRASLTDGLGVIATAVRSSSKPGRGKAECWLLQAGPEWSSAHLENSREDIAEKLLIEFSTLCGARLPSPIFSKAHRWRYAVAHGGAGTAGWNDALRLGACGDWCHGPTIEDSWRSGDELGLRVGKALRIGRA